MSKCNLMPISALPASSAVNWNCENKLVPSTLFRAGSERSRMEPIGRPLAVPWIPHRVRNDKVNERR